MFVLVCEFYLLLCTHDVCGCARHGMHVDVREQLCRVNSLHLPCFYVFLDWTQFICMWDKCFTHWEVLPTFAAVILLFIFSSETRSPVARTGLEFTREPRRMTLTLDSPQPPLLSKCWVCRHTWPHLDRFWASYQIFLSAPVHFNGPILWKIHGFVFYELWMISDKEMCSCFIYQANAITQELPEPKEGQLCMHACIPGGNGDV